MNLLTPLNTETLIAQNTMPLKAADSADRKNSGSFSECLDGVRANTSKTIQTGPVAKKTLKAGNEKNEEAGSDTDKSSIVSDNPLAAAVCTELCPVPGDINTDTKDTTGTAEGSADNTASFQLAGQENDKAIVSAGISALSKTPLQHAKKGNQHESTGEISGLTQTGPESIPVNTEKGAIPVTDNTEKKSIPVTDNTTKQSPSSVENTAGENTESGENAPVENGSQASVISVIPEAVQVVTTKDKVSASPAENAAGNNTASRGQSPVQNRLQSSEIYEIPDTSEAVVAEVKVSAKVSPQQGENAAELNMQGQSVDNKKVSPESPNTALTNNQETGEKGPDRSYSKMDRAENATAEPVATTVLPATPKTQESDITPVQKGEAADSNSQGKSADKIHGGQKNDTTAASAKIAELSDGNRSQSDKDFMQSVKPEQIAPRKEIVAEHDQNDIKKNHTELTNQSNEKSGELFSLQDSNATTADGVRVVNQKTEVADISRLARENFIITRKDNTSIELTIEPEGMGKLNIHLSLDKGAIHARINASENIGKDFIDRNLNNILQTLSDDGINIGSFSINLRDRKDEFINEEQDRKTYRGPAIESPLPVANAGNSTINIFV
jgi:flagellar hook-length control protein FliK